MADEADAVKADQFMRSHWFSGNVLSHEQIDAYGTYDKAAKALDMQIFLLGQIGYDGPNQMVEMGHC